MNCKNHPKKEASASCVNCGDLFCPACLVKVKSKNYCKDCAAERLGEETTTAKAKTVVVQQEQHQQQGGNGTVIESNPINWKNILKWIIGIVMLIVGLAFLSKGNVKGVAVGVIFILLGIYWIPPARDSFNNTLNNRNITIPTWLSILASIIIFFIAMMISAGA